MLRTAVVLILTLLPSLVSAQRLPGTVTPHHYDLFFQPDLETFTFEGSAGIDVSLNEPTRSILIHALELELDTVTVRAGEKRVTAAVAYRPEAEMAELTLAEPLPPGPARIEIDYRGILNDQLRGFYRGEFSNGEPYASTQLESTSARQMFPSFDEPAMKATFRISAEADRKYDVFSNSRALSDTETPGGHLVEFATTPRMSTYLVAMAVGDFATIEDELDGVPLRIIAAPDKIAMGRFAMEATKEVMSFLTDYYGMPYPFDKLDQIAIPDFQAGAMENTGAIIYRETALLIDDRTASEDSRRYVASVVAHEIAHQWFGNLVTMDWWDDIWLNEGFASWMEDKPLEVWKPEWDIPTRVVAGRSWPLSADSLPSARTIRSRAETSAEIDQMFDGISYGKGSALLSMIESWIGEETFRDGIRLYLRRHAWRNTSSSDFAIALADVSDLPVGRVVNDFVTIAGIPLVTVSTTCNDDQTIARVTQRRFVADPERMRGADDSVWALPVCLEGRTAGRQCFLLDTAEESFTLPGCGAVWANADGDGYYITRYDERTLESFAGPDRKRLDPAERLVLLRDAWLLVRANLLGVDEYLSIASSFRDERHRAVMNEILTRLDSIDRTMVADPERQAWREWLREWLNPLATELGWSAGENESPEVGSLRAAVLKVLTGAADDSAARRTARSMAESWLQDPASIDPQLAGTVLSAAARDGDERLFDQFTRAAKETANPIHRSMLMNARTDFDSPELHRRVLEETLTDAVRIQDARRVLSQMMSNPAARDMTWNFIRSRWDDLSARLPAPDMASVIGSASVFCSAGRLAELDAHVSANPLPEGTRNVRQARESIEACTELRQLQAQRLSEWIAEQR